MQIRNVAALLVLPCFFGLLGIDSLAAKTTGERGILVLPRSKAVPQKENLNPHYTASYALIIGIDKYTNGWPELQNAVKDAELIAAEMSRRGFKVTLRKNLNSKQLKQAFERFYALKGADPKARLFVWYAGHGHTISGEGYLVAADAPRPDWADRNLVDFKLKALNLRRFGEYVRLATTKHSYTVFDSCFGGKIFGSTPERAPMARLYDKPPSIGQFLTAGSATQKVADDGEFRELFIRAINGSSQNNIKADINGDGLLTTAELGKFMAAQYAKITQGKQTPRANAFSPLAKNSGKFVFRILPLKSQPLVALSPVDIWTYDKGSFERIVFDWPKKIAYRLDRKNNKTRLIFQAPADLEIFPLVGQKLRNVVTAKYYRRAGETILTLDIPANRYVHDFIDGNRIVLDVVNPQVANNQQLPWKKPVQVVSYPVESRVVTRSFPDIIRSTARIFRVLQLRPAVRMRYRDTRIIRQRSGWRRWSRTRSLYGKQRERVKSPFRRSTRKHSR